MTSRSFLEIPGRHVRASSEDCSLNAFPLPVSHAIYRSLYVHLERMESCAPEA